MSEFISKDLLAWLTGSGELAACSWCERPMDTGALPLKIETRVDKPLVAMCTACQQRQMPDDLVKNRRTVAILKAQVLLDLSDNGLLERYGLPPTLDVALESIGLSPAVLEELSAQLDAEAARRSTPVVRESPRVGRNDACPCGSGRKFKRCCGAQ
jgi:hypothetical protein